MYHVVSNPGEVPDNTGPIGFQLRHKEGSWGMHLVPLAHIPMLAPDMCPTCKVTHMVKTVHLQLEPGGTVIVSSGVYQDLQKAGLDNFDLEYVKAVRNPPPLRLGRKGTTRAEVDYKNRLLGLGAVRDTSKKGASNG